MIAFANSQKSAEGQDRVADLTGELVHHEVVDGSEMVALSVVDVCALDLVGCDQAPCFVDGDAIAGWVEFHGTRLPELLLGRQVGRHGCSSQVLRPASATFDCASLSSLSTWTDASRQAACV